MSNVGKVGRKPARSPARVAGGIIRSVQLSGPIQGLLDQRAAISQKTELDIPVVGAIAWNELPPRSGSSYLHLAYVRRNCEVPLGTWPWARGNRASWPPSCGSGWNRRECEGYPDSCPGFGFLKRIFRSPLHCAETLKTPRGWPCTTVVTYCDVRVDTGSVRFSVDHELVAELACWLCLGVVWPRASVNKKARPTTIQPAAAG